MSYDLWYLRSKEGWAVSLFGELKRRNVIRAAVGYAAIAWLLTQIADTVFPLFGFDATPARIVFILLILGFIPMMVLTWVFELTPEGLKSEKEIDPAQPVNPAVARKLDGLIMLALALALGYFAFDKFVLNPMRTEALQAEVTSRVEKALQEGRSEALIDAFRDKSIAVLAFQDMSQEGDQEYLSDGIAEELLNLLARIPELRVISRSSAFSYKNKDIQLAQLAQDLHVSHVLEGSVRKSGNRVRITVQLIEARSDTHLWSETYDRTLEDIFSIQDEIATAVVEQLKVKLLSTVPTTGESDPTAFALVLEARYLARQGSADSYARSNELYRQALKLSPEYAEAWDGLAANYSNQADKNLMPYEEGYALAREAAERALAIDPDHAPALAQLGWIAMVHDNDLPAAALQLERALALEPTNLGIIGNAASLLFNLGRFEESVAFDEYVNAHDPVNPTGHSNLGKGYLAIGNWDAAITSYRNALRLSPGRIAIHYFLGVALMLKGDTQAALEEMQKEEIEVLRLLGLVMVQHALGQAGASDAALAELIDKYAQDAAYNLAYVMAWRDETDRAFEWLSTAREYADPGLADIVGEPLFARLNSDPRWVPFLESLGKAPSQLGEIPFETSLATSR